MNQAWTCISFILMLMSSTGNINNEGMSMDEICDNGIDDNNDGLIDLNDPMCVCEMVSLESLIPNPSFEEYNCCPETDSQLNCAKGWDQASGGTTDYINTCDYLVAEQMLPFPDGEGAIVFLTGSVDNGFGPEIYKEYAGACLNRTMQKDSVYKFKFHLGFLNEENSPEIRFAFFGSPNCANLPFSQWADCPSYYPDWYFLKSEFVNRGDESFVWIEVTTEIRPSMDINALVIGADCGGDSEGKLRIYFLDNLRLNDESNFDFELLDKGSPCGSNFSFAVKDNPNFDYQWYKEGIALIGETESELSQMYGEGSYQLRIINENTQQCRVADEFEFIIPVYTTEVFETICEGGSLLYQGEVIDHAGTYEYSLTSVEGCDSIVMLHVDLQAPKIDTVCITTLPGTTISIGASDFVEVGEYYINLVTSIGCDSTIFLQLKNIDVYIPNIFSPNGDGRNDYFEVVTSGDEYVMKEMSIYDRWGNLLYSGTKWDGTYNNSFVNAGIYVYTLRIVDISGQEFMHTNSITLIR